MMGDIDNYQDVIDVRDVIEAYEELEDQSHDDDGNQLTLDDDDAAQFAALGELLSELKGYGGDEQWRGDWYPITLIRDTYFQEHAQELAEDIGAIPDDISWPCTCIDWERAARELQMDYTSVDYQGVIYWYR